MVVIGSFLFAFLFFIYILGFNMGRFLGFVEEWHDDCDLEAWGQFYNGRKTYYILFVPIFRQGFYHSTMLRDW